MIKVLSPPPVSLEGCNTSATRSKKRPPRWCWAELTQTGRLSQHPRCDVHCHGTSAALVALNLCQWPPEPAAWRPDSDRRVLRLEKAWDLTPALPSHLPPTSIHFPAAGLCQPKRFSGDDNNSWFSPNHLPQLKKNLQSMLTCFLLLTRHKAGEKRPHPPSALLTLLDSWKKSTEQGASCSPLFLRAETGL